jgi:tetratricopeptide (TPR) repeat protein
MGNVSEIRIFISSTFRDLKDERDYLMNVIFPELIRITRERGLTFTPIDLRWGIPDESFIFKVIKTCFDEIDRARPYFIGIVGERYGYVPSEDKDANLNLETIENKEIKKKLDEYTKNNLSITQMEMEYGVFSKPENAQFSYFYFKKGENKNERINRLKEKIRVDNSTWNWSRKEFESPKELGEQIKNDYMAMLDANFPKVELTPLDIERRINREYSEYILKDYLPDEKTISDVIEELDKNRKILVTGEVGIGKSSALAYIARKYEKEHQGALVIEHYFGATESYTSRDIAIRMLNEIKDRLEKRKADIEELEIPKDELEIFNKIGQWITKLPNWEDTLLLVDGTDQVDEIENLRFLAYLPDIRVIASARANTEAYRYAVDDLNYKTIELKPLNEEIRKRVIRDFLERHGRRLTEKQLELVVNARQTSNPLYLRIFLEEILRIGELRDESSKESQDQFIKRQIERYLRKDNKELELKDLYGLVIERIGSVLKKYFNADASDVMNFLRTIAVSRNGLSQYEIEQVTNIEPLYFSIIRNNLDYHIASKNGLLDFFHYSLKEYVYENYLQKNEEEKKARISIANYFKDKETDERKIYEFPYQLYNLNDKEGMKKALKDPKWLLIASKNRNSSAYFELIEYIRFAYGDTCIGIKESFTAEIPEDLSEKSIYLMDIGNLYDFNGCYREAEPLLKQSLEIMRKIYGEYHPSVAISLNNLALLYYEESKYNEAEPLYKQSLEIRRKIYGEYHPSVATSLNNLAELYDEEGRYDEAEPLYKQSLEIRRKIYGEYHPDVAGSLNNLAALYLKKGKNDEAEPLFKQALEIRRKIYGEYHPSVATSLNNLAALYLKKGKNDEAEPLFKQALEIFRKIYGEYHPSVATSLNNLAELYYEEGKYDEAEPLFKQSLEIIKKIYGEYHPSVATSLNNLALLYLKEGKYDEAEPLLKQSLEIIKKIYGEYHPSVATSLNNLAELYDEEGRYDEAEPLFKQSLEIRRKIYGEYHPSVAISLNNLALLYYEESKYNEAEPLFKQALEIFRKIYGGNDFRVASIFFELGALLIARIIKEKNPTYCNEARNYLTKARELFLRLNYKDLTEKTDYSLKELDEICPK